MTSKPTKTIDAPKTAEAGEGPIVSMPSPIFDKVQVALQASLGEAELSVSELLALKAGSIVKLGLKLGEPIDLKLNDALIARGEIVAVGENFGVRIVEVSKLT